MSQIQECQHYAVVAKTRSSSTCLVCISGLIHVKIVQVVEGNSVCRNSNEMVRGRGSRSNLSIAEMEGLCFL